MVQIKSITAIIIAIALSVFFVEVQADTVIAVDGADIYYRASATTLKKARTDVFRYCKEESEVGKCLILSESKPRSGGYAAIATSQAKWATATGHGSQQDANAAALESCASITSTKDVCNVVMSFYDDSRGAVRPGGEGLQMLPVGNVVRYSDNCYNGDCVRTFESGKKFRFQAPYCYDALAGNWDWKPNGC